MQHRNWDDLRYLLAVQRGGTLSAAARRLGVDLTTVSRRLKNLQESLDRTLVERQGDGKLVLTADGNAVAGQAAAMERHAARITETPLADEDALHGTVRMTTVPVVAHHILMPELAGFVRENPHLQMEMLPDSRDYSLTRREADLALRLNRPVTGGTQVKARRIGSLAYGIFAAADALSPEKLGWITFDEAMAHVPQARWIARTRRDTSEALATLKVRDGDTMMQAVLAGLGKSPLPIAAAGNNPQLVRLDETGQDGVLQREAWLLVHTDLIDKPHIRAVMAWISRIFERNGV